MPTAYLDYAATAPPRPQARKAMQRYLSNSFGNPSSMHSLGLEARASLDQARAEVARLIGASPHEIVFTSGGTEAINLAIQGVANASKQPGHLITPSIEHPATLETVRFLEGKGWRATFLPVDGTGLVNPDDVRAAIAPDTRLISVMHANNEVGTVQFAGEIGRIAREHGLPFHVDAVQSAGKISVSADDLRADLLSLSAHKLGGPKGAGALYVRAGTSLAPLIHGGGQELGLRSGTENVAAIAGFGAAAAVARSEMGQEAPRETQLRDRLADGIMYSVRSHLNGHQTHRLPGFVHVSFEGLDGHWLVKELARAGISASTGSACHSGKSEPSHVLVAMGLRPDLAAGSVRFTLGWATTVEEVRYAILTVPQAAERVRSAAQSGTDLAQEFAKDCRSARDEAVGAALRSLWDRLGFGGRQ